MIGLCELLLLFSQLGTILGPRPMGKVIVKKLILRLESNFFFKSPKSRNMFYKLSMSVDRASTKSA